MKKRLVRALLVLIGLQMAAATVGWFLARRFTFGDEASDEFRIAAFFGGKKFSSAATALKSAAAITTMGGIDLDLRDAVLDPSGADLDLHVSMGGVQVLVPEEWRIEVDAETHGGELQMDVTPPEALPDDAPLLRIHGLVRLGGGVITAKAA